MASRGLAAPCRVEPDDESRAILAAEAANVRPAIELARNDPRLGFHGDSMTRWYDAETLAAKVEAIEALLGEVPAAR